MKYAVLLFWVFISTAYTSISAEPQKVVSLVKECRSSEWYMEQIKLWKSEIEKNKKNAPAWQYYFAATRMLNITADSNISEADFKKLKTGSEIIADMEKAIPNTYEFNYCTAWHLGGTAECMTKGFTALKKAEEFKPDSPDLYSLLVVHYEKIRDLKNKKYYCEKWYKSNDQSPLLMNFAYNTLTASDDNAIIFTSGDNDTYPMWILQNAMNIKPNIYILNYSLLFIDDYREKLFKELNIPELKLDSTDFDMKENENPTYHIFGKFFNHIVKYSNRPIYFSNTCNEELYSTFKNKLYLVGTTCKYSEKDFDNTAVLRNNFENIYLLDNLQHYLIYEPLYNSSYNINTVYLPAIVKLYKHYKLSGDKIKMDKMKNLAISIVNSSVISDKDILNMFD